jgi:apolipoprotein N-acyltransferase
VACLPLLLALAAEKRPFRAFLLGYLSGVIFLAGSCYWFVEVMERYGGLSPPLAVGVLGLFALLFGTFFGVFGLVTGWMGRASWIAALEISPFLWVAMELARTYLITGVPWNLLGYAVAPTGLRQVASVTGVYGLSFLALGTSALLACVLLASRRRWALWGLAGWVAVLGFSQLLLRPGALPPAANQAYLLQPNVPLDPSALESWEPWRNPVPLNELVKLTLAASGSRVKALGMPGGIGQPAPPLIVWAENPAPFYFTRDPVFHAAMEQLAQHAQAYLILNTVTFVGHDTSKPQNSAIVLDPTGRVVEQYAKIHLVPFGEYVPAWAFPSKIGKITSQVGDFVPGSSYRVARTPEGTIAVSICYEDIFPQLIRRLAAQGAGVLVNISNDAWYDDTAAAPQHLEMARLRAIENHRYLLRATDDGITAVIDPYGRLVARLPRHRALVLSAGFSYLTRQTFYTAYGDVFAWLCVAVMGALMISAALSRRRTMAA